MYKNRIHYRNTSFLHIGHMQTIFFNNDIAGRNNGICCAIVDDRQNLSRTLEIQSHFDYLKVKNTRIIPVRKYLKPIMIYTKGLIDEGDIYLYHSSVIEKDPDVINNWINKPRNYFQLRLRSTASPTIGYTQVIDGELKLVFLFDYIIKVLDHLLEIQHIITTSPNDITDIHIARFFEYRLNIRHDVLPTYRIDGFKYSKKDWPNLNKDDPRLLTLPGLKARHVPPEVLYAFYLHAMQVKDIKINYIDNLLRNYLNYHSYRVFGVLNPVKVEIQNWKDRNTEFICKPRLPSTYISTSFPEHTQGNLYLSPLSQTLYIDKTDFGFHNENNLSKNREVRLKYGHVISCTDVEIDHGIKSIKVDYISCYSKTKRCIHWVSSEYGEEPVKALFYLYNTFYTGMNSLLNVVIKEGYIENEPFNDLNRIYQLERTGYFIYDENLSKKTQKPCFIRICNIKN